MRLDTLWGQIAYRRGLWGQLPYKKRLILYRRGLWGQLFCRRPLSHNLPNGRGYISSETSYPEEEASEATFFTEEISEANYSKGKASKEPNFIEEPSDANCFIEETS